MGIPAHMVARFLIKMGHLRRQVSSTIGVGLGGNLIADFAGYAEEYLGF